ncbi:hypothetical protein RGQ29_020754 [Quercus rubra]|uniref:50S ribosomal protein L16, chloroplastic n=1 Tax=Quercus rubra TaxID=3512 RepID=A0AAN7FC26_QUERU|nr:hypothetical protein RGQ29_020754 [Quercus rubra]
MGPINIDNWLAIFEFINAWTERPKYIMQKCGVIFIGGCGMIEHLGSRFKSNSRYALQALEPAWITSRQIEAGRRAMTRNVHRGGKIWVRIFPDKPVTVRPAETRMGFGKGSPEYWVAIVKPGRILYEMGGVAENVARKAISIAASKMPIRTQFIISG